jgi:hypothetical protein
VLGRPIETTRVTGNLGISTAFQPKIQNFKKLSVTSCEPEHGRGLRACFGGLHGSTCPSVILCRTLCQNPT